MIIVGDHLAKAALNRSNISESDLFARSAFNRYYYAVFLIVKEKLSVINPKWGIISHKDLPEVLKGQVITKIKHDIKRKIKKEVFKPHKRSTSSPVPSEQQRNRPSLIGLSQISTTELRLTDGPNNRFAN